MVWAPAHLAPPRSPQGKQLCSLHTHPSPGQSCHGEKKSCVYACGVASVVLTLCDPVDWGLPGFSIRGILQARILGRMGQHWSPYPSRALYFLLPWPPTPPVPDAARTLQPKQLHHLHAWPHRGRPKSSRAASGANPSGRPHTEVEIKAQLKPRGSVAKEEDPKPSHQLHKLQIKST